MRTEIATKNAEFLKTASLITLAIQNSSLILLMRYSRTLPGEMYLASVAVLMAETVKLLACVFVEFLYVRRHQTARQSIWVTLLSLGDMFSTWDAYKLAIPAILYTIQNNLQYLAVGMLDAATYQVSYQFKIITTAIFSVIMLNRTLSRTKWLALGILTFGVAMVQLPSSNSSASSSSRGSIEVEKASNTLLGLVVVVISCCLSGLAGVYFEKILKRHQSPPITSSPRAPSPSRVSAGSISGAPGNPRSSSPNRPTPLVIHHNANSKLPNGHNPSLWERNIQLAAFSVILALLGIWMKDADSIAEKGWFTGFNGITWIVVTVQALGGLIVAVVVKYADNILKGFATSLSIIISSVVSVWLFDFVPSFTFITGALLVIYATYLYEAGSVSSMPSPIAISTKLLSPVRRLSSIIVHSPMLNSSNSPLMRASQSPDKQLLIPV